MTIGLSTQSTTPSGTTVPGTGSTSVSPGSMTTPSNGQKVVLVVLNKPDTCTPVTPTGWTLIATVAGGAGTTGSTSGPVRITAWERDKDAGWSAMPTNITFTGGTNSAAVAQLFTWSKDAANSWATTTASTGSDTTTGTGFTVGTGSNPGLDVGDTAMCVGAIPNTATTWSTHTVTATGTTWSTRSEASEPKTTTGNDIGGCVWRATVTAGTGTANPVIGATLSSTTGSAGCGMLIRLREFTPPAAPTARTISADATSTTSVLLSWADDTAASPNPTYDIEISTDGTNWSTHDTGSTNQTQYSVTGLTTDQPYWFRVTGTNASGSALSNEATATPALFTRSNDFEMGTDGVDISSANSGATGQDLLNMFGGAPTHAAKFSDAQSHSGSLSMHTFRDTSGDSYAGWSFPERPLSTLYGRAYVYVDGTIGSTHRAIRVNQANGTTEEDSIYFLSSGIFRLGAAGTTSTYAIPIQQWFRLEFRYQTSGSITARLFVAGNVDGTTPDDEWSWSTGVVNMGGVRFGPNTSAVAPATYFDDIALAEADWIGPAGGAAPTDVAVDAIASAEAFGSPTITVLPPAQTCGPSSIVSAEAFGSPTLTTVVTASPSAIASAQAFGSPVVTPQITVTPTGITTVEAFGAPTLLSIRTVSPLAIASLQAFGSPTIAPVVSVSPTGIPTAEVSGNPVLMPLITVSPSGIPTAEATGAPTLTPRISLTPLGISSLETFGQPVLSPRILVSPSSVASAEAFGSPVVAIVVPAINVAPASIASLESMGNPSLSMLVAVTPSGIASAQAFGSPVINTLLGVVPSSIASAQAIGSPVLAAVVTVAPGGVASAEACGAPTLSAVVVTAPSSVASAEALGLPSVAVAGFTTPAGIASAQAFGTPTVTTQVSVSPLAILSAQAMGNPVINVGLTVVPTSIASAQAFGSPTLLARLLVTPTGVVSGEAFGTTTVMTQVSVSPTSIASAQAMGAPTINFIATVSPAGIPSAEVFGLPTITTELDVTPTGVPSAEAVGNAIVSTFIDVLPFAIASAEAFGQPTTKFLFEITPVSIESGEAVGEPFVAIVAVSWVPATDPDAALTDWADSTGTLRGGGQAAILEMGTGAAIIGEGSSGSIE